MGELVDIKELLREHGQEQLLEYWDELDDSRRSRLCRDIERIDFSVLEHFENAKEESFNLAPIDPISCKEVEKNRKRYEAEGRAILNRGEAAAVLLSGGYGSRLGFAKPKGMFDMGETREVTIFSLLMDDIKRTAAETKPFHLFVMTNRDNGEEVRAFFDRKAYFDYPKDLIHFFPQDETVSCDFDFKIFLDEKDRVSLSPNGNGGWFPSLLKAGYRDLVRSEGIKWFNVFAVDNVLQKICSPYFLGAASLSGCDCAAKVVKKTCPEERVGVLCERDGRPAVVEYYEMPDEKKFETKNGVPVYNYGVILNYLFDVETLEDIATKNLPYHAAKKIIPHMEDGVRVTPKEPCGYKFETLAADMVQLSRSCIAVEVERECEFAPVKNATGSDSPETARELLKKNGIQL